MLLSTQYDAPVSVAMYTGWLVSMTLFIELPVNVATYTEWPVSVAVYTGWLVRVALYIE